MLLCFTEGYNLRENILAKIAYFFPPPNPEISYFFPDFPKKISQIHKNLKEMVRSTKNLEILVLKMTKNVKNGTTEGKRGVNKAIFFFCKTLFLPCF